MDRFDEFLGVTIKEILKDIYLSIYDAFVIYRKVEKQVIKQLGDGKKK